MADHADQDLERLVREHEVGVADLLEAHDLLAPVYSEALSATTGPATGYVIASNTTARG